MSPTGLSRSDAPFDYPKLVANAIEESGLLPRMVVYG
jgi:hypothetical protein